MPHRKLEADCAARLADCAIRENRPLQMTAYLPDGNGKMKVIRMRADFPIADADDGDLADLIPFLRRNVLT